MIEVQRCGICSVTVRANRKGMIRYEINSHIQENHPEAMESIRERIAEIERLEKQASELRWNLRSEIGYRQ